MFNISTVQTAFLSLIGWRNTLDPAMPALTSALTASDSGLYYNDAHPLVSIENIDATAPDYDGMGATVYDAGVAYSAGALVRYNYITYVALQSATNKNPVTETAYWQPAIQAHITNLTKTAIVNMVHRFINDRQLQNANKALLDDLRLFDGEGRVQSTIISQSRFVGFEIKVRNYIGLVAVINRIGLQFTATQTSLKIYLFHSSQSSAVATFTATTTKAGSMEWFVPVPTAPTTVPFELNFCKYATADAGGAWYVGYFETDVAGQAINRDIDLVAKPCSDCFKDIYNLMSWETRNRYISVTPCEFPFSALNGEALPDMSKVGYTCNVNYGLNIALSARCDLTDFFVDNRAIFTRTLWKQVALDVVRGIAYSTRVDGIKNELKQDAYAELKGDPNKAYKNGIEHECDMEYKGINFAVSDLNSPCMNKPHNIGLKVGAI